MKSDQMTSGETPLAAPVKSDRKKAKFPKSFKETAKKKLRHWLPHKHRCWAWETETKKQCVKSVFWLNYCRKHRSFFVPSIIWLASIVGTYFLGPALTHYKSVYFPSQEQKQAVKQSDQVNYLSQMMESMNAPPELEVWINGKPVVDGLFMGQISETDQSIRITVAIYNRGSNDVDAVRIRTLSDGPINEVRWNGDFIDQSPSVINTNAGHRLFQVPTILRGEAVVFLEIPFHVPNWKALSGNGKLTISKMGGLVFVIDAKKMKSPLISQVNLGVFMGNATYYSTNGNPAFKFQSERNR